MALPVIDHLDHEQHHRHLDQRADDDGQRGAYSKPNSLIAAATASSKKLDAPISADGQATECCSATF